MAVHPDKTRLIRFGRFAKEQSRKYDQGKLKTFDFLGFTFYCGVKRNGEFKVGRKTIRKRLNNQIKNVQRELRKRMHEATGLTLKWLQSVLNGHINYYGVPGNSRSVSLFHNEIMRRWYKMLRRGSQRFNITWEKFGPRIRRLLPKVRVVHPYTEKRFRAKHSK